MTLAAGPFMIAATLLVVAGVAKVVAPSDTAIALRGVGVRVPESAVRVGAGLELVIGVYALIAGDRLGALLVAISYLVFLAFVAAALARAAPIATCGCFGKADTPPSVLHLAIDGVAVVAAILVAIDPGVGIRTVLERQPLAGGPYLLLVATGVVLAYVAMSALPRALAMVRTSEARRA